MVKNLTEGAPLPLLFFFSMPMVVGNLFQQLYNMVDTAVVGKFVGEDAVLRWAPLSPSCFYPWPLPQGCPWAATWWSPSSSVPGASMR